MIFVTVGGQLAFDRLISAVDRWAAEKERRDIFAQIGPSGHAPEHMTWARNIPYDSFQTKVCEASALVAHAGLGSIITALENAKPIILFPRRAALGEQRNDHQLATARAFSEHPGIAVAFDETDLRQQLDNIDDLTPPEKIGPHASPELLAAVREFIEA
jgi:UDP-N-acetylglucosamine transferase subunit ALG13